MANKYAQARARLIYPETLDSEQIRELAKNPIHLLIWYSLYHAVDDQGRLEARVSTIQASCLRHLPEDAIRPRVIQEAIARMRSIKDNDGIPLIYTYEAAGTLVLQIAKWWIYQSGMKNSWPSRWPKPPVEVAPMWTDEIRGYGRKVFQKMVENGEIEDTIGANVGPLVGENIPVKVQGTSRSTKVPNLTGPKPFDLVAAYLEGRGLPVAEFPGLKVQLAEAKRMLADGFTAEEVRTATVAFSREPYWVANGFDLGHIHRNWAKLKTRDAAKPRERPLKPAQDGAVFD